MANWTVGPLTPVALPYADLGAGTAKQIYRMQQDAPFAAEFDIGDFILSATGSVTVQADAGNINPMLVRVYHRPGSTWHNLGEVAPGETETFAINYDVTPEDAEIESGDEGLFELYFRHEPTGGNVRFTVTAASISYAVTDVEPTLLLVEALDVDMEAGNIAALAVPNMLDQVAISSGPAMDWLEGANNRRLRIELDGGQQANIGVEEDPNYGVSAVFLESGTSPGVYTQSYRVRLYTFTDGGEGGEETETEITTFAEGSDLIGVITFELTDGGEGQEPCSAIPHFTRSIPFCG